MLAMEQLNRYAYTHTISTVQSLLHLPLYHNLKDQPVNSLALDVLVKLNFINSNTDVLLHTQELQILL